MLFEKSTTRGRKTTTGCRIGGIAAGRTCRHGRACTRRGAARWDGRGSSCVARCNDNRGGCGPSPGDLIRETIGGGGNNHPPPNRGP